MMQHKEHPNNSTWFHYLPTSRLDGKLSQGTSMSNFQQTQKTFNKFCGIIVEANAWGVETNIEWEPFDSAST